jgi:hypothetical protein
MAHIQPVTFSISIVPYANVGQVDVTHSFNRYPEVRVYQELTTGVFGFGNFGVGDFGASSIVREIDRIHVEVVHIDQANFQVRFDNNYVGEIHYF